MSTSTTQTDLVRSINGYDEIAVEKHFADIDLYPDEKPDKPVRYLRALVFIERRHNKIADAEALHTALTMSVRELGGYFAPEPDEHAEVPEEREHAEALGKAGD